MSFILNRRVFFCREREGEHGSHIRQNGQEYETVKRFNAEGRQLTVRLNPHTDASDPVSHFLASVNDLFESVLCDVDDSDMVGITIQNQVNQNASRSELVSDGKISYPGT